jgi:transposase-like protein
MKRTRRTFSREYKFAAVKKVIKQGLSYCEVARDLGIRDTLIHNWRKAFEADGTFQAEITQSPSDRRDLRRGDFPWVESRGLGLVDAALFDRLEALIRRAGLPVQFSGEPSLFDRIKRPKNRNPRPTPSKICQKQKTRCPLNQRGRASSQ